MFGHRLVALISALLPALFARAQLICRKYLCVNYVTQELNVARLN